MAASSPFTPIPTTQPPCGPISLQNPFPHCSNTTTEPQACFIQPTGFLCAPLSTTRGFIYTLNNSTTSPFLNSSSSSLYLPLVPRFSTASLNTSTNATGIDGQSVRREGPIRLGQPCSGIPLPPSTDPSYAVLVAMANQNLVSRVGHPGLGAEADVLALRSDCEAGSYCDFSKGDKEKGQGLCKEQYPLYHACGSYLECISLRCDTPDATGTSVPASAIVVVSRRRKRGLGLGRRWLDKDEGDQEEQQQQQQHLELLNNNNNLKKRRSEPVCLPPSHHTPGGGGGGGLGESNGDSKGSPVFPHWAYALIAVLIVVGAGLVFVLTRRQRRRRNGCNRTKQIQYQQQQLKGRRSRQQYEDEHGNPPMMTKERERTMSSDRTAISSNATAAAAAQKASSSVLGRWLRSNNSNNDISTDGIDLEKRGGSKMSAAATDNSNNYNTGTSGTESVTDNGSVYSSNSAFRVEEPLVAAAGILGVPQDGVDGASDLGLYYLDIHDDESRGSLAHDNNSNNSNNIIHLGNAGPPPTATNSSGDGMKGPSSSIHSGPLRPVVVLPRIITTSFPETSVVAPTLTTTAETSSPSNHSQWASTPTNMVPSPSSLTLASGATPAPTSSPSSPSAFATGVVGVSGAGGQSPAGGGHHRHSARLAGGGRSNSHHQHHQFGRFQEGEAPLHTQQQQQQQHLSTGGNSSNKSRKSKHSSTSTSTGSSLIPPPSPISPISPISPASANGGTVGTSRLSSRW